MSVEKCDCCDRIVCKYQCTCAACTPIVQKQLAEAQAVQDA